MYHDSIHGKKTNGGAADAGKAPTCTGCHGAHKIRGKMDADSRVSRENIAGMCGSCHQQVYSRFTNSMHGQMRQAGNSAAPTCIDCHSAHGIQSHTSAQWQVDVIKECGNCHGGLLTTYRDTYHGQVTKLGFARVATCNSCHGAHEVLPASNPKSMISPENRVSTCRSCHPGANANFAAFKPHGNPHDREGEPHPVLHAALHGVAADRRVLLLRPAHGAVDAARAEGSARTAPRSLKGTRNV